MRCEDFRNAIDENIDLNFGDLQIQIHLKNCRECAQYYNVSKRLHKLSEKKEGADVWEMFQTRQNRAKRKPSVRLNLVMSLGAAAAIAIVSMTLLFGFVAPINSNALTASLQKDVKDLVSTSIPFYAYYAYETQDETIGLSEYYAFAQIM